MLKKLKIPCDVVLCPKADTSSAEDTKLCAQIMKEQGVDLLVFCGGDGTARDICEVVGTDGDGSWNPVRSEDVFCVLCL